MCVTKDIEVLTAAISGHHPVGYVQLSSAAQNVQAHALRMRLSNPDLDIGLSVPVRSAYKMAGARFEPAING